MTPFEQELLKQIDVDIPWELVTKFSKMKRCLPEEVNNAYLNTGLKNIEKDTSNGDSLSIKYANIINKLKKIKNIFLNWLNE